MFLRLQNATAFSFQRIVVIVAVLIALTGLPRSAVAQAVYGSIAGTVVDPSGGALPGVSVTVTSVERKTTDTIVTNETGRYVKERLLPGTYEVKVELSGFKQSVYPSIRVNVDTQTTLDVKLEVGAVTEAVTVEGFTPILKTDRADVSSRFDTKELTELPVLNETSPSSSC